MATVKLAIFSTILSINVQVIFGVAPAPYFSTTAYHDMAQFGNWLWGQDTTEKLHFCDVWMNFGRNWQRNDQKLFEYVDPSIMDKTSFAAFADAFYRTRAEVQNSRYSPQQFHMNTLQLRRYIFGRFFDAISTTPVFQAFEHFFTQRHHAWFTHGHDGLKQKLTDFWVNPQQHTGFDFIFMGDVVRGTGHNNPDTHQGMSNWFAFHLSEENNVVHYNNILVGPNANIANGNNPNLRRYGLVSDISYVYNDYRYNRWHFYNILANQRLQKNGHAMLMRTSPAFEFCLYTIIALMNNGHHNTISNGVHDFWQNAGANLVRVTKTTRIEIDACPIDIVLVIAKTHQETYIENAYPQAVPNSDHLCNLQNNAGYAGILNTCGRNPHNLQIQFLQRNSTKKPKL